ncbi:MAG TPA: glycosyl hydrolase [Saprospiraceae bacterium]|nr:glycosyl hydrolase [Saprospiraceae bacterium]
MKYFKHAVIFLCLLLTISIFSQDEEKPPSHESFVKSLEFRNIGPAFTSGRIADVAIHPSHLNTWYVAVGSGGVWKTTNAGTTWTPVFDQYPSYSTGCITIDPQNPNTLWLGTGENVGGRHVAYGDGVYRSDDAGKSWKNVGLKNSGHISKIIVHPNFSEVIWVAAQGPLWSNGGERGVFKSTDGGKNWKRVLGDEEWVGATDILIDPRDPMRLYAATWQRHRNVAAYMGGGPGTGLFRSEDGGETWKELTNGIPRSNKGKIGMAISPFNPDIVYADIELDRRAGGLFMSTDRGASWKKMSDAVSGVTGPHYYQELYASPHKEGRLYLVDMNIQISEDHGKTFTLLNKGQMHSDAHSINFRPDNPDYLLVGTDGGLYESFDHGDNWRFIDNMSITQFYKLAVDDAEPFYFVYGGTQDNGSMGGPSRTDNVHGIRNADWFKTLGGDGHQSATEPGNPNIIYAESQQGVLHRVDRITGEQVFIQPQAREGEPAERYNWDAPILVSAHNPTTIYFASYRVWKSDNRGDSWQPISGDLTRNQERFDLPIMGRKQSWDNPWDIYAMSKYNTITSLAESPKNSNILYAGTDDGLLHVTTNGGSSWTAIEIGSIHGIPATAFINDVRADLFDENTVYVALDNHKFGDLKPYLIKSSDRGRTWQSIAGDIPDRHLVWRLVQDHEKKDLLFAATEFGIFCTVDGGRKWFKMSKGVPTISFRDITIQRRENDLVGATFGRGFYVLDDYTPLRDLNEDLLKKDAVFFEVKDALWYVPRSIVSSQGESMYAAPNPKFGAVFSYYLKESTTTRQADRKKAETKLNKELKDIPFPGWDALEMEMREEAPRIVFVVKDEDGNIVRMVNGPASKGLHRINWDLRLAPKGPIGAGGMGRGGFGFLCLPGTYNAHMYLMHDGQLTDLGQSQTFVVKPLREGALTPISDEVRKEFMAAVSGFQQDLAASASALNKAKNKMSSMKRALLSIESLPEGMVEQVYQMEHKVKDIDKMFNGHPAKAEVRELDDPTPSSRMFPGFRGLMNTYGPTLMQRETIQAGINELQKLKEVLKTLVEVEIPALEKAFKDAGAPWMEGDGMIEE